jgi:hypothetical protein
MKLLTQANHVLDVLIPIVSLLVSVAALVQSRIRRGLFYALIASVSLKEISGPSRLPPGVLRKARAAAEPHLLLVSLYARGVRDIRAEDFSDRKPLVLCLGARVVMVAGVDAGGATKPDTRMAKNTLEVRPSLLRKGKRVLFYVLVDGPKPALSCEVSPLADVAVRPAPADQPGPVARWVPFAGVFGSVLIAGRYPDGHLTGWPLVATIASAACIWVLVFVWAGKVGRKAWMLRDLKRRDPFTAARTGNTMS